MAKYKRGEFPTFTQYMGRKWRRGRERLPFYDDKADYNTNSKSYYDYLARFNGFLSDMVDYINDLADKIKEMDDEIDDLWDALQKIIDNLYQSGAIDSDDPKKFKFKDDRNIATGNINLFTNKTDGDTFIRTTKGKEEYDVTVGYTKKDD